MIKTGLSAWVRFNLILRKILILFLIPIILFILVGALTGSLCLGGFVLIGGTILIILLIILYTPLRTWVLKGYKLQPWVLDQVKQLEEAKKNK